MLNIQTILVHALTVYAVASACTFLILLLEKTRIRERIQVHGNAFWSALFSCDFCLSFWSSLIISIFLIIFGYSWVAMAFPVVAVPLIRKLL